MSDARDELIPPDDQRFEGTEFLNDDARLWHVVQGSTYLRGLTWSWQRWRESDTVEYDPRTGEETPAVWDHNHCHFCYDAAFSERYDGDLREGWTTSGPAGRPPAEWQPNYHWVCAECFTRYRDEFGWNTTPTAPPVGGGPREA